MAKISDTTKAAAAASAVQLLMPRRAAVKAAIDALEPIMTKVCDRPSSTYNGLQTIFDNLLDEMAVIDAVIMALPVLDLTDLVSQAALVKYRYGDDNQRVEGSLGQFLDNLGALAA